MQGWRPRLQYFWTEHGSGVVGMLLCAIIGAAAFGAVVLINGFRPRDLSLTPPIAVPTEGTIVGFIGGDTKYSTSVSAYVRTDENGYGFVRVPFFSGCHNGDRIFMTRSEVSGRQRLWIRPPGCSRP